MDSVTFLASIQPILAIVSIILALYVVRIATGWDTKLLADGIIAINLAIIVVRWKEFFGWSDMSAEAELLSWRGILTSVIMAFIACLIVLARKERQLRKQQ